MATPIDPSSIGKRNPMRSPILPAYTARKMGNTAYIANRAPIPALDAPSSSANSDTTSLLALKQL